MAIQDREIINVIRRALRYIDPRLMDHGERVAYIIHEMLAEDGLFDEFDWKTLFILGNLHDIGAYKTEEIDRMVEFETHDVWNHSIFGYLFLKHMTPSGGGIEAILFHHTGYRQLCEADVRYRDYAALICLADRIDVLVAGCGGVAPDLSFLHNTDDGYFSPRFADLFLRANENRGIVEHLMHGDATYLIEDDIESLDISQSKALEYLKMLVYAIDFRSPFTVTHTITTMSISIDLARLAGLDEEQVALVSDGALLHDIGKVAMPVSILEKPGKLEPGEMAVMRTHVDIGEQIISGVVPDEMRNIAICHHEKLNGEGYPRGLGAADLGTAERIVAMADIMSALIRRRSYKEPFSKGKTLGIIGEMCEKGELCPEVYAILLEHYDEIIETVETNCRPTVELYNTVYDEFSKMRTLIDSSGDEAISLLARVCEGDAALA